MSSESAKTFGFMMRPAVCSSYSSRSPTSSPGRFSISSRTAADERLRQVVDDRGGVVRRQVVEEAGDLLGRAIGEQRGAPFGPELAERFHRQLAVALDEEREGGAAILLAELGEDLGEVGGMLLVQEIDEVRRRAEAHQAPDGIEDDVNLALRHAIRSIYHAIERIS